MAARLITPRSSIGSRLPVVVLGEAAPLSSQRIDVPGAPPYLMGMNRDGIDNQQFALNIMRWLMGVPPEA